MDGFDQFWAAYPRRIAKLDAQKAWVKLKPDALLLAQILESIEEHIRSKQWRDGFIPYPATFLRQGRWMDELGYDDFYHARL